VVGTELMSALPVLDGLAARVMKGETFKPGESALFMGAPVGFVEVIESLPAVARCHYPMP